MLSTSCFIYDFLVAFLTHFHKDIISHKLPWLESNQQIAILTEWCFTYLATGEYRPFDYAGGLLPIELQENNATLMTDRGSSRPLDLGA